MQIFKIGFQLVLIFFILKLLHKIFSSESFYKLFKIPKNRIHSDCDSQRLFQKLEKSQNFFLWHKLRDKLVRVIELEIVAE